MGGKYGGADPSQGLPPGSLNRRALPWLRAQALAAEDPSLSRAFLGDLLHAVWTLATSPKAEQLSPSETPNNMLHPRSTAPLTGVQTETPGPLPLTAVSSLLPVGRAASSQLRPSGPRLPDQSFSSPLVPWGRECSLSGVTLVWLKPWCPPPQRSEQEERGTWGSSREHLLAVS